MKNAARMLVNKLPHLHGVISQLAKRDVLVGVPMDQTARKDGEMNNATLAYIHDNGSAAANIPARPFMEPGIHNAKPTITLFMKSAAQGALNKGASAIDVGLNKAGMTAQSSIRAVINAGIAPPVKTATLKARVRNRTAVKGALAELARRDSGEAAGSDLAKPLIVTGQLRNSITYVVRNKA